MKKSQLLGAIFARFISALIILSPAAFADESVNEHKMSQNVVNANTKQWGIPPRYEHWTIPPINKQWGIPPRTKHWTIPRSASSLKSSSVSGYSSEAHGWNQER
jgi:hypothetical protein